jgi:hypothetical protein
VVVESEARILPFLKKKKQKDFFLLVARARGARGGSQNPLG